MAFKKRTAKAYANKIISDTNGNLELAKSILGNKAKLAHDKGVMHEQRFEFMSIAFQEIEVVESKAKV